jgi:hypothetical protein
MDAGVSFFQPCGIVVHRIASKDNKLPRVVEAGFSRLFFLSATKSLFLLKSWSYPKRE